jgi:hypothetical protein
MPSPMTTPIKPGAGLPGQPGSASAAAAAAAALLVDRVNLGGPAVPAPAAQQALFKQG